MMLALFVRRADLWPGPATWTAWLARVNSHWATMAVSLITPTMTILSSSRKMTFQSMPVCSKKNAAFRVGGVDQEQDPGPPSAAATRWTFSVAISV